MLVGIHDADKTTFPNLALMKLSAAYKAKGHVTEFYIKGRSYDKVVSSKVFSFTQECDLPDGVVKGGYGRGGTLDLPEDVEHITPDYSLYGVDYSLGFLTRGCPNKCSWCFVPQKEGAIRAHADFTEFVRHSEAVFMDNNVLACDHGVDQIAKLGVAGIKVDFNQGLDPRRIDDGVARRLSKLKWKSPVRLACDSSSAVEPVRKAVELLRWHNVTPRAYFCYVLIKDVQDALERIKFLKGMGVDPFAQPFIDRKGTQPSLEQRQLARWCNSKMIFKSCTFEDYVVERGNRV